MSVIIDGAKNAHHVDHCGTFHGGPSRDREVPCAVRIGSSSGSFCNVERNRDRCPAQLLSKLTVSSGNRFTYHCGNRHKLDRALVHIQLLKTQHAPTSVSGDRDCVAVAVADNAHAHAHAHDNGRACRTRLLNHRYVQRIDAIALTCEASTLTTTSLASGARDGFRVHVFAPYATSPAVTLWMSGATALAVDVPVGLQ